MPHLHLETTADLPENVDVPDILEALVVALSAHDSIKSESVKAYHTLYNTWHMGEGAPPGFAHLTVKILTGRSIEIRKEIADRMLETLRHHFAMSLEANEVNLTVDIHEMLSETYRKA